MSLKANPSIITDRKSANFLDGGKINQTNQKQKLIESQLTFIVTELSNQNSLERCKKFNLNFCGTRTWFVPVFPGE